MRIERLLTEQWDRKGFTLIELLIVIAIILILISIALPNFLEAQMRAKITKVKSELRTIATALEAYQTEWKRYPPTAGLELTQFGFPQAARHSLMQLTTPIAHLTEIPLEILAPQDEEPFVDIATGPLSDGGFFGPADRAEGYSFYYFSQESFLKTAGWAPLGEGYKRNGVNHTVRSTGPDRDFDFNRDPHNPEFRNRAVSWFYCPTNGTHSGGDIIRWNP